ncbi:MAG: hypothetical protein ABIJ08_00315, partial [Nanoarchaeota archaeon]
MLHSNEALLELAKRFPDADPDWEKIFNKLSEENITSALNDDACFRGIIGEIHAQIRLEDICAELGFNADFSPLNDPLIRTANFEFNYARFGRTIVVDRSTQLVYSDLDVVFVIEGLPVLVEVKLNKRFKQGGGKRANPSHKGISYAISPGRVSQALEPVKEYFRQKYIKENDGSYGYALVTYPSIINDTSQKQRQFRELGGIFIPFYADHERYLNDFSLFM